MYYNPQNLPERDLIVALAELLIEKEVFTDKELLAKVRQHVDAKNKQIEEEKEKNPAIGMLFDMFTGNWDKDKKEE